ncbi:MAG: acyl-CoA thioesterase [Robiginitalea sp.]|jgi:acyl-CoA thioester hydrolase|nr:MAG: acyl-CoA thioesterase [Flavobacteriaceae bacterium]
MNTYRKTVQVREGDLDALEHVNNIRYLEWVQDISKEHWDQLSNPEWDKRYLWVVRSHSITYHQPALLGQILRLTTFVPESRGPISRRKVDMVLEDTGKKIAECLTEWVLLEAASGRPTRIPEEVRIVFE